MSCRINAWQVPSHARRRSCDPRKLGRCARCTCGCPGTPPAVCTDRRWRHGRRSSECGSRLRIISSRGGAARTSEPRSNAFSDGPPAGHELLDGMRTTPATPPAIPSSTRIEQYHPAAIDALCAIGRHGHRGRRGAPASRRDSEAAFVDRVGQFIERLHTRHGLLRRDESGIRFGFIHGNWALDNSLPGGPPAGSTTRSRCCAGWAATPISRCRPRPRPHRRAS